MTLPVKVDSTVLRKEAANFERIAESLKDQIARVQRAAAELVAEHNWKGSARDAVNGALNRDVEAARAMSNGLNDNSTKLETAGLLYDSTDEQESSRLAHAMGFGDETDDSHRDPWALPTTSITTAISGRSMITTGAARIKQSSTTHMLTPRQNIWRRSV